MQRPSRGAGHCSAASPSCPQRSAGCSAAWGLYGSCHSAITAAKAPLLAILSLLGESYTPLHAWSVQPVGGVL